VTWHLVSGDYAPAFTGGVAVWTERVVAELHGRGLPVTLHARGAHALGRRHEARHDRVQPFPLQRIRARRWNERQADAVAAHLVPQLRRGDVVLATTWPLATGLGEPCNALGIPLLVTAHGSAVSRLDAAPPTLLALARSARFAAVSRFLVERLADLGVDARCLPAPVDPAASSGQPREGLLLVARCTPLKGLDRGLALGDALGWPVTVVGEGPVLPQLRRQARGLGVPVHFAGRLPFTEVARRYQRAALVAQLSRVDADGGGGEGLGLVVLEAIAHGAPAVVSDVGGLPEAAGPGVVLEAPDDAQASARAVLAWLARGGGPAAQSAWLEEHHGTARCVDALLAFCQDGAQ
jgi:glycosyltransferase involved in cell wall biosynthesis